MNELPTACGGMIRYDLGHDLVAPTPHRLGYQCLPFARGSHPRKPGPPPATLGFAHKATSPATQCSAQVFMYATITKTGRIWDSRRIRRQAGCLRTIPPWETPYNLSHDSAACIIATHWQRRLTALHFGPRSLVSRLGAHPSFFVGLGSTRFAEWLKSTSNVRGHKGQGLTAFFCARKVLMNYSRPDCAAATISVSR
jgi:hypothetical protein